MNFYLIGVIGLGDKVFKVIICGLLLFVDDSVVFEMLDKFEINRKSEIKYENIRYFIIYCMINVLNWNWFLYIVLFFNGKFFLWNVVCVNLKCWIYY